MDVFRNVVLAVIALVLSFNTANYARKWRSDFALWCYAAEIAPQKPRPWINCGAAVAQWPTFSEPLRASLARSMWLEAQRVADSPHVLEWDRVAALRLVEQNLATLDKLEREGLR